MTFVEMFKNQKVLQSFKKFFFFTKCCKAPNTANSSENSIFFFKPGTEPVDVFKENPII